MTATNNKKPAPSDCIESGAISMKAMSFGDLILWIFEKNGVNPEIGGKPPKGIQWKFHGKNPMNKWMIWGVWIKTPYF